MSINIHTQSDTLIQVYLTVSKKDKHEHKTYYVYHDYDATSYCSMRRSEILNSKSESVEEYQTLTEQDYIFEDKDFFLQKDFEEMDLTEEELKELCEAFQKAHNEECDRRIKE